MNGEKREEGGPIQLYRIGPHLTDSAFRAITGKHISEFRFFRF